MAKPKKNSRDAKPDYRCDVCGLRFQPGPVAGLPDDETWCPRCHTPFVHPVTVRGGSFRSNADEDVLRPPRLSCG